MSGILLPQTVHGVFTSIEVVCYGGQCGCLQSYPPPVSRIPYSEITTTIYSFPGRLDSLSLLCYQQNTIDVTNSVMQIIITFEMDFVITKLTISDTVSAFTSVFLL